MPKVPTSTQAENIPIPTPNIVDTLLSEEIRLKFKDMLRKYDSVFNPCFSGYNGASGPLDAKSNMGPIQPPQRKGRVPQYSKDQLSTLQEDLISWKVLECLHDQKR